MKRLLYHLGKNISQLESRGISVPELAEQVGLSREETEGLVRQACRHDSRLLTVVHEGTIHLCRSPLAEESNTMSLRSWIRKLLRLKPTVGEQVRDLDGRSACSSSSSGMRSINAWPRWRARNARPLRKGPPPRATPSGSSLAGKLVRTRRDLRRVRAQANVYTQQIDILGTHIHHLTLAEQGKRIELPKAEELTREAAEAEQMMAELAANADLAAGIEVGAQSPLMAEEEAAIMEEFKQAAAEQTASQAGQKAPTPPVGERPDAAGDGEEQGPAGNDLGTTTEAQRHRDKR